MILNFGKGWVGEVRFDDHSKDRNFTSTDHEKLLDEIQQYIGGVLHD